MHTPERVSRSFSPGGYLELNVNVTDNSFGISHSSLVWYHNETELVSGDRRAITNNHTTLIIRDMRSHDAGEYKVNFSYTCPYPLPSLALFAPVTFTVQGNSPPTYNPLSRIPTYYVSAEDSNTNIMLMNISVNTLYLNLFHPYWYRNGRRLSNVHLNGSTTSVSLQAAYTDIGGIYIGLIEAYHRHQLVLYDCCIGLSQ